MVDSSPAISITIIIPVYNGELIIGDCLESLLHQEYPQDSYEIIVVENGSTDRTSEVVSGYPVRLLHSPQRGPAAARNLGLVTSQADIIAFLDADCYAHPFWLANLARSYADPDVAGVGGAILPYPSPQPTTAERFSCHHAPLINYLSGEREFMPHLYTANASYRRIHLKRVGGFDSRLLTGEDVDLSWRVLLDSGKKLVYQPQAVVYHRHRTTCRGLARQYRQYGYGEILLDTIYGSLPGYPRGRSVQYACMLRQAVRLPFYGLAFIAWGLRRLVGKATPYDVVQPLLRMMIEASNLAGKLEALRLTHGMRDRWAVERLQPDLFIRRHYANGRE